MTARDEDEFHQRMRRKAAEQDMKHHYTTVRFFGGPLDGEERQSTLGTIRILNVPLERDFQFMDFNDFERQPEAFMPRVTTYEFKGWKEGPDGTYARYDHYR